MKFFANLFRRKQHEQVTRRDDHSDVYHVKEKDESMNWAMEKARLTLNYFKESLTKPQTSQTYFSLKAKIVDGGDMEHIWLNDVSFDESNIFYGTIGNEPLTVRNVSLGTEIGVDLESVSDWMIVEDGRLIGGYTIRCIRDGISERERKNFDKSLGIFIDEGVDYFDHDLHTPEGALLSIEDAYDAKDLERAMACKDFTLEAQLMLSKHKSFQHLDKDSVLVETTAKAFQLSFIKFFEEQGFPSFQNVKRAFTQREFVTPDICIVTEVCFYDDHTKSLERIYVGRKEDLWYVMGPAD